MTRAYPALYVALSGFGYPLSGLLLPGPLSHVSGSSVLGVCPFRVLLPLKCWSLFRGASSLALWLFQTRPRCAKKAWTSELCSLQRAVFFSFWYCTKTRAVTLLGFCISEAFSPPTLQAVSGSFLFCTFCSRFCQRFNRH